MTINDIREHIREKGSFLCIGLDPDPQLLPQSVLDAPDPLCEFARAIIDATHDCSVAFKPNTAFFEAQGHKGWEALQWVVQYIRTHYPRHLIIADAKRGDIGNTARQYAKAFFEVMPCDAITVAPYMGSDSVEPFLELEERYAVLLALTSNEGSLDFQLQRAAQGPLYEQVILVSRTYRNADRLMYVVGATQSSELRRIRELLPDSFLLVPGVGSQGGSVEEVCRACATPTGDLLINVSRAVLYASDGADFAEAAREVALRFAEQMRPFIPLG